VRQRENNELRPAVIKRLLLNNWGYRIVHGSMYQVGFPDLYCYHKLFGARWVELKMPGNKLRVSQVKFFSDLSRHNIGVWVCSDPNEIPKLLMNKPNWIVWMSD